VNPHLPAQWQDARINNLVLPDGSTSVLFAHAGDLMTVSLDNWRLPGWKLRSELPGAELRKDPSDSDGFLLAIPLAEVEIGTPPAIAPVAGTRTSKFRIISEEYGTRRIKLTVEGLAGSQADLLVIRHRLVKEHMELPPGVDNSHDSKGTSVSLFAIDTAHEDPKVPVDMHFQFGPGEGWQTITLTLSWEIKKDRDASF